MKYTADAVIVGAGITGASIAFHLARSGLKVICVEKTFLAAGATGKSSALIRMHYDNEPEILLAHKSSPYFQNWKDMVGEGDCGFVKSGYIRLVNKEDEEKLKNNVQLMQQNGVNTSLISGDEVKEIAPTFCTDDIDIAAWEPDSGYADPSGTTYGFIKAAQNLGAEILFPEEVRSIDVNSGRIKSVKTRNHKISTAIVVNAAGAFASAIGNMVGIDIPVEPIRYQAGIFRRPLEIQKYHPIVMDRLAGEFYFRPEGHYRTLVGGIGAKKGIDPDNYNETTDEGYSTKVLNILSKRIPGMVNAVFLGGRAGCDGISSDEYAILDKFDEVDGFYTAVGHSGHGFKIAPAVGIAISELVTRGQSESIDISAFSYSRFINNINPFNNANTYSDRGQ